MSNPTKSISDLREDYASARKAWKAAMLARRNAPFGREWSEAHARAVDAKWAVEETKAALYAAIASK